MARRAGQLIQARVMTLFGLSAADPRGKLEGVTAPALTAISTQTHLPVLDLPCNAISRHCGSLIQRNRLASGCRALVHAAILGTLLSCVTSTATAVRATDRWPVLHHARAGFEKTRSQCGPKLFAVGSSSQIVHCTRYTLQPAC
jgi:hypothetical protein